MFRVGQKVVCVKAYCEGLEYGKVYTVTVLHTCCMLWIGVGFPDNMPDATVGCPVCGNIETHIPETLYDAKAFRPVIDLLDEQLDQIENTSIEEIEEELYQPA